jgi:hypothetical protein
MTSKLWVTVMMAGAMATGCSVYSDEAGVAILDAGNGINLESKISDAAADYSAAGVMYATVGNDGGVKLATAHVGGEAAKLTPEQRYGNTTMKLCSGSGC